MPRTVVRLADLPPPRKVSDENFENICLVCAIPANQRIETRAFLDECATEFGAEIQRQSGRPTRKQDRYAIEAAIKDISRARHWLHRTAGPAGTTGLRIAGRRIGPSVAASWMRRRFPDDRMTPAVHFLTFGENSLRSPARSSCPADRGR